jgi:hypothetical protein
VNLIYAKRKVFVKLNNDGNENEKAKSLERRLRSPTKYKKHTKHLVTHYADSADGA